MDPIVEEGRAAIKAAKEWIGKVFPPLLLKRAAERSVVPLRRLDEQRQTERAALSAKLAHMQDDLTDRVVASRLRLEDALRWLAEFADHAKEQLDQALAAFKAVASAPLPSEAVLRRILGFCSVIGTLVTSRQDKWGRDNCAGNKGQRRRVKSSGQAGSADARHCHAARAGGRALQGPGPPAPPAPSPQASSERPSRK